MIPRLCRTDELSSRTPRLIASSPPPRRPTHPPSPAAWKVDGDSATVGITGFAAEALGDIVYVELPDIGAEYDKADSFGSVESVKVRTVCVAAPTIPCRVASDPRCVAPQLRPPRVL
jgi:hypothetical protein